MNNRPDLEYLKAVNIEDSDAELLVWLLDGFIYGLEKTEKERNECFIIYLWRTGSLKHQLPPPGSQRVVHRGL